MSDHPVSDATDSSVQKTMRRRSASTVSKDSAGSSQATFVRAAAPAVPTRRRSTGAFVFPQKPVSQDQESATAARDDSCARRSSSPNPSQEQEQSSDCPRRGSLGVDVDSEAANTGDSGSFAIGDRCLVGNAKAVGVVRFIGSTEFAEGTWIGVALDEALGKNDGTVRGKSYFECKPMHGIFCRASALSACVQEKPTALQRRGSGSTTCSESDPTRMDNLQSELAEAVEDHDIERIQQAIKKAASGRLCPRELENAQRVLNFELSKSLQHEIQDVRDVVASLSDAVHSVGIHPPAKLPVNKQIADLDNKDGPSMTTIADMIEKSRDEIVKRLEESQHQMLHHLENILMKSSLVKSDSSGHASEPPESFCRPAPPPPAPPPLVPRQYTRQHMQVLEAEALEDSDNSDAEDTTKSLHPSSAHKACRDPSEQDLLRSALAPMQSMQPPSSSSSSSSSKSEMQALEERLRYAEFSQREAAACVIQASWRMKINRRGHRMSIASLQHPTLATAQRDCISTKSDDVAADKANRPDLSGHWQFSFEGVVHTWIVNGTMAYTPDGADESGEHLEIISENGKEALNGWCLMGMSSDGNLLLWEDSESFERVVWIRTGLDLESMLSTMDEDVPVNIVNASSGTVICELIAEKIWLASDLMEAVQDSTGLHPRAQKLHWRGQPLSRGDEPIVSMLSFFDGRSPIEFYAGSPAAERSSSSSSPPQEQRRPSLQDIKEAARCAESTILAAVRLDPDALRHAPDDLTCDRDLLLTAVKEGANLASLLPDYRADKEIVLAAVQRNGMALEAASEALRADREVVITSVLQDVRALRFGSPSLQQDREILQAVAYADVPEADMSTVLGTAAKESLEAKSTEASQQDSISALSFLGASEPLCLAQEAAENSSESIDASTTGAIASEPEQSASSSPPVLTVQRTIKSPAPREESPREVIAKQDVEYHESELVDAKKEVDAQVDFFTSEVKRREQRLEQAEDALSNANGRLERYGDNPRVEQERQAAEALVREATESLQESQSELSKFSAASSTLAAELTSLCSPDHHDECEF